MEERLSLLSLGKLEAVGRSSQECGVQLLGRKDLPTGPRFRGPVLQAVSVSLWEVCKQKLMLAGHVGKTMQGSAGVGVLQEWMLRSILIVTRRGPCPFPETEVSPQRSQDWD